MRLGRVVRRGVSILAITITLIGCGSGGTSSPGAVVERFFSLSNRGQTDQALECVSSDSQWSVGSSVMWDSITGMVGVKFSGVTIDRVEISGDVARVRYRLRYSPSLYNSTGEAELQREDGRWLIVDLGG